MNRRSPTAYALALINGVVILRIVHTGEYRLLVQPGMGPWLVLSGFIVSIAAVVRLTFGDNSSVSTQGSTPSSTPGSKDRTGTEHGEHERGGHDEHDSADVPHRHPMPKVALLLIAPVAALLAVQPTGLGSFAAGRTATLAAPTNNNKVFLSLATDASGVASPGLLDLWRRASFDPDNTLSKQRLRLIGFISNEESEDVAPGTFRLTRFTIACCAADALPVQARIVGYKGVVPPVDSWVEIVGTYDGLVDRLPTVKATELRPIPQPRDPYE